MEEAQSKPIMTSVIYVNYYGVDEIVASITSVLAHTQEHSSIEFIVVSNSPLTPEDKKKLEELHKQLTIFPLDENIGFARANNIGAAQANGEYLFFLNPDTRLLNDAIYHFIETDQQQAESGILGPATFDESGHKQPSVKHDPSFKGMFSWLLGGSIHGIKPIVVNQSGSVEVVNGSAMFIRANLFKQMGGMCEQFFMYWEEHDLCLRCRQNGKRVWYTNEAEVQHIGGTSTQTRYLPMEVEKHRSLKKFLQIHSPSLVLLNRIFGSISYFGRTVASILLLRRNKIRQFGTLFIWYTFRYH